MTELQKALEEFMAAFPFAAADMKAAVEAGDTERARQAFHRTDAVSRQWAFVVGLAGGGSATTASQYHHALHMGQGLYRTGGGRMAGRTILTQMEQARAIITEAVQ